jgi:hypothetical protein
MANMTFTEASGVADSIFGKSQAPIRLFIEKKGEAFEQKSIVSELYCMDTSTHWGEKMSGMTAMDGFQPVGENGAHPEDGFQETYSKFLEHMTWKDSFTPSREMVEDAKLLDLKAKPAAFVTGYYRTREIFGAALLGGALNQKSSVTFRGKSFDTTTADALPLFSQKHTSILDKKLLQSNLFADAFSNDALMALESKMQDFRGDNNEVLDISPDTIVIPNDYLLKKEIFAAIGADKDPETANNGFNYNFGRWNVIVWPYLNQFVSSGSHPWILLASDYNKDHHGLQWFDRTKLEITSSTDRNTNGNIWDGYARFIAGFNDWRALAVGGVTGGTSLIG